MDIRICRVCGKEFEYVWNKTFRYYCSKECRYKYQLQSTSKSHKSLSKRRNIICPDCGGLMSYSAKRKGSKRCRICHINLMVKTRPVSSRHGGKKDRDGYRMVYYIGKHPRGREGKQLINGTYRCYVPQHVIEWEKFNKISLPEGFTVHHLNGIKDDNRPKNLVALPTPRHNSGLVNKALQSRIRELESIIAQSKLQL